MPDNLPECRRVIHLYAMGDLMRYDVVKNRIWCEYETPREHQVAGTRARAPAAQCVAHRDAPDLPADPSSVLAGSIDTGFPSGLAKNGGNLVRQE